MGLLGLAAGCDFQALESRGEGEGRRAEVRGQRSEVGDERPEIGSRRSEIRGRRSEIGGRAGGRKDEGRRNRRSEAGNLRSRIKGPVIDEAEGGEEKGQAQGQPVQVVGSFQGRPVCQPWGGSEATASSFPPPCSAAATTRTATYPNPDNPEP